MLSADEVSVLLNRSLSSAETTNFKTYLKIATARLEELLCLDLCGTDDERTYTSRYGYREVYIDPFTDINSVMIDGEEVTNYIVKQNDKHNGRWFNILQFDDKRVGEDITVDASFGFGTLPSDLQLLLAKLFNQGSAEQTTNNNIKSKKIEDFTVTFKDSPSYDEFVLDNSSTIEKYAQCNKGQIRNGSVREYGFRSIR